MYITAQQDKIAADLEYPAKKAYQNPSNLVLR